MAVGVVFFCVFLKNFRDELIAITHIAYFFPLVYNRHIY